MLNGDTIYFLSSRLVEGLASSDHLALGGSPSFQGRGPHYPVAGSSPRAGWGEELEEGLGAGAG